ncbi:hypothetical protein ACFQ1I_06490 [Kitasatospora arboriphila]
MWAVLDAVDGRVLGRVNTMTVASGSEHAPHPDPARKGLSIGEGEEGSPVLSARGDGQQLTAEPIGIEQVLLAVSPSGRRLLTVDVGQWPPSLRRAENGSVVRESDARDAVPTHPGVRAGTGCTGTSTRPSSTRTPRLPVPRSATPGTARRATGWSTYRR